MSIIHSKRGGDSEAAEPGSLPPLDVSGQELTIFTAPLSLMHAWISDFQAAAARIWIESYIVLDDWIGEKLAEVLLIKARQGVDVRVLYDPVGSKAASSSFFRRLREGGVRVRTFHPVLKSLLTFRWQRANRRNHRRLCIVDDNIGYFGGMNVGDYGGTGSRRPRSSRASPVEATWPDVHVRLAGPRQAEMAAGFETLWESISGEATPRSDPWDLERMLSPAPESICFFASDPRDPARRAESVFIPLFRQARESITLLISYFVPQGAVLEELYDACRRGVVVRLIVPAESDVKLVQFATRHFYAELLRHGIEVHERLGQMLHAKLVIIDGEWSIAGSCNIDPRSLWINLEFFAAIRSRQFAARMEEVASFHLARSRRVLLEETLRRHRYQRLLDAFAWSLRRWL